MDNNPGQKGVWVVHPQRAESIQKMMLRLADSLKLSGTINTIMVGALAKDIAELALFESKLTTETLGVIIQKVKPLSGLPTHEGRSKHENAAILWARYLVKLCEASESPSAAVEALSSATARILDLEAKFDTERYRLATRPFLRHPIQRPGGYGLASVMHAHFRGRVTKAVALSGDYAQLEQRLMESVRKDTSGKTKEERFKAAYGGEDSSGDE